MEKKFLINPDCFKAFAFHARGNLSADRVLCQSMAYLIGYKVDDTYVSTELVFPRQESYNNSCKELGMILVLKQDLQNAIHRFDVLHTKSISNNVLRN